MSPSEILLSFIGYTRQYLRALESAELVEMLALFRAYILNGYEDEGLEVPAKLSPAWERCRARLRRCIGREENQIPQAGSTSGPGGARV